MAIQSKNKDKQRFIPMEITRKEATAMGFNPADVRPVKIGSRLVEGMLIPAESEKQYRGIIRDIWAEEKRIERDRKCSISNGRGKTKRCDSDCSKCAKMKTGSMISTDNIKDETGKEIPEPTIDTSNIALTTMLFNDLMKKLQEQDPQLAEIFSLLFDGESQRSIAKITGIKAQSSVESKIHRMRRILQQHVNREDITG